MGEFVRVLVAASEKAANIARAIRRENELFQLLIQEKSVVEKNHRFVQDFKTLADVLIQESLRHDISGFYPEMANNIYGEENNTFRNSVGETVTITIEDTPEKTAVILSKVLEGNLEAEKLSPQTLAVCKMLADEVHKEIVLNERETSYLPDKLIDLYSDVGVWIDPIVEFLHYIQNISDIPFLALRDATNEYIRGSDEYDLKSTENEIEEQIWPAGLHCVTVLIGAFNMHSGQPILGVINQPFWKLEPVKKNWQGRFFWGLSTKDQCVSSLTRYPVRRPENSKKIIILSPSEDSTTQNLLKNKFDLVYSSGAGFKLLCVALGLADIYLLTKGTTHFWDVCSGHAILKSLGGGVANFDKLVSDNNKADNGVCVVPPVAIYPDIKYSISDSAIDCNFANEGGILAYREAHIVASVIDCLASNVNVITSNYASGSAK